VRTIAVVFLLMTAVEIFGCELLSSPDCELSTPANDAGQDGNRSADECFCCCNHVAPGPPPIALTRLESIELVVLTVPESSFEFFTPTIDQPPRF